LHQRFAALAEHPAVAEIRSGLGALTAVQLEDAAAAPALVKRLRTHGVATRAVGAGAIQVSPAFVMTDEQVDELVAGVRAALG
jgi:adenosylmethionine-8-amino-7-oxononanoate aminotransferase